MGTALSRIHREKSRFELRFLWCEISMSRLVHLDKRVQAAAMQRSPSTQLGLTPVSQTLKPSMYVNKSQARPGEQRIMHAAHCRPLQLGCCGCLASALGPATDVRGVQVWPMSWAAK